jgi:hypothetical protein
MVKRQLDGDQKRRRARVVSRNSTVGEQEVARKREHEAFVRKMTPREKKRLADIMGDAGVGARRVAIELLYLLPADFVTTYEDLFHRAILLGDEGRGAREDAQAELGRASGKTKGKDWGSRGGSGDGSRKGSVFPVNEKEAFEQKEWVDRQLRKLARQIKMGAGSGVAARVRCSGEDSNKNGNGCGRWLEEDWDFCPRCGTKASKVTK